MSETTYQWLRGVFLSQKLHWRFDMEAANSPQPYGEWNLATPMLRSWAHERGLLGSAYLPPGRGIDVPGRATRMQWPEAEAPILWPPDAKSQLFRKDPDAGNDWRQKEKEAAEDEMVGWHHQLNGTWVWANSGRRWRTGSLAYWVHGVTKSWTRLSAWTRQCCRLISMLTHPPGKRGQHHCCSESESP